jgi:predicted ArsR family transcriptional regulator
MHPGQGLNGGACRPRLMTPRPGWTFITSHALVLLSVERRPDATVRELAAEVGLTERQVHRVLGDLAADGYIRRRRVGRQNHYTVDRSRPMRDTPDMKQEIGELLATLNGRTH